MNPPFTIIEGGVTLAYLSFKVLVSLYLMVAYIISHVTYAISVFSGSSDWPFYWIYFTCWSWTLLVVSFLFDTIMVIMRYREQKQCLSRKRYAYATVPTSHYTGYLL